MNDNRRTEPEQLRGALAEAVRRHLTGLLLQDAISAKQMGVLVKLERASDPEAWARIDRVLRDTPPLPLPGGMLDIEPQLRAVAQEFGWDEDECVEVARQHVARQMS
jgi:hypothetical protein